MSVYSQMDPIRLHTEELDYELSLRGVFNLSTVRQKTQCLREFLRREALGESTLSPDQAQPRDSTAELAVCANIVSDVCRMMEGSELGDLIWPECRSRLIHVVERIKRSKQDSPESQTLAYDLLAAAEARLVDMPTPRTLLRRSTENVARPLTLPLVEAIEQIQHCRTSMASTADVVQRGRMSELNPTVPEFEPRQQQTVVNPFSPPGLHIAPGANHESREMLSRMFDMAKEAEIAQEQVVRSVEARGRSDASRLRTLSMSSERAQSSSMQGDARLNVVRQAIEAARSESSFDNRNIVEERMVRDGRDLSPSLGNRARCDERDGRNAVRDRTVRDEQHSFVECAPYVARSVVEERRAQQERNVYGNREALNVREPQEREGRIGFGGRYGDRNGHLDRPLNRVWRKTVPVHQWRVSFSGDGHGLSLHDFLSELHMLQRSEGVSDEDLFASIVHLLTGRARLWFRSWYDTFRGWHDFLAALKTEFLPPKYDYRLLTNISNRRQKQSETFAEFLTIMQSQFNHLAIRVDEQHKLSIVEENMLPKYAVATSTIDVRSLEQLSSVCRRVDYAYAKRDVGLPFEERPQASRAVFHGRSRDVQEVEVAMHNDRDGRDESAEERIDSRATDESELCAMRRGDQSAQSVDSAPRKCFNCGREGHNFADCKQPKTGPFCYRCGSRNFVNFTCKECPKNCEAGSMQKSASNHQKQ